MGSLNSQVLEKTSDDKILSRSGRAGLHRPEGVFLVETIGRDKTE